MEDETRSINLTIDQAEMLDIFLDNIISEYLESHNSDETAREEVQIAIIIRSQIRHKFPEIEESLKVLDKKITQLFPNKKEGIQ